MANQCGAWWERRLLIDALICAGLRWGRHGRVANDGRGLLRQQRCGGVVGVRHCGCMAAGASGVCGGGRGHEALCQPADVARRHPSASFNLLGCHVEAPSLPHGVLWMKTLSSRSLDEQWRRRWRHSLLGGIVSKDPTWLVAFLVMTLVTGGCGQWRRSHRDRLGGMVQDGQLDGGCIARVVAIEVLVAARDYHIVAGLAACSGPRRLVLLGNC